MPTNKLFYAAFFLPIVILLSMTVKPLQATYLGETIQLQTAPYDPRDLFYGDYVVLQFEIEQLPLELLDSELEEVFEKKGDYIQYKGDETELGVYVLLEQNEEGIHEAVSVTRNRPVTGTYVKGKMDTYASQDQGVFIDIPIDRYYLEENTGRQLEEEARLGKIIATMNVYKGYPILNQVELQQVNR